MLGLRFQTIFSKPLQVYGPAGTDVFVRGLIASMAPPMEAICGVSGERSCTAEQLVEVDVVRAGETLTTWRDQGHSSSKLTLQFQAEQPGVLTEDSEIGAQIREPVQPATH